MLRTVLLLYAFITADSKLSVDPGPVPVPNPARPKPYFSWDYIPLAFHGANRSGMYNESTVEVIGKHYQLFTIEKWYTECGSQHPNMSGPVCNVEKAMFKTFNQVKAINPKITNIMYLNSMMDFTMYHLHQMAANLEAKGTRIWLRDKNDKLVIYCNDGNYFCNVLNWDWTQKATRDLYTEHVLNATKVGGVNGLFADHAAVRLERGSHPEHYPNSLCNGKADKRICYYFEPEFATAFDAAHAWIINHTQDILAPLGGPVVDGPYAVNAAACDFNSTREKVRAGQDGTGRYILEFSHDGGCTPDSSCIASFLLNAVEYTYLSCMSDEPTFPLYPDLARPLGPPLGDARLADGVWTRKFEKGAVARWYVNASKGTIQWAGQPVPPPPPSVDTKRCGKLLVDTTIGRGGAGMQRNCTTAQACCDFCLGLKHAGCVSWAWHSDVAECSAHNEHAATPRRYKGTFSGFLPK